jgi:hypothetical protein
MKQTFVMILWIGCLTSGCNTTSPPHEAFFSSEELKRCEQQAQGALDSGGYFKHPGWRPRSGGAIVQIGNRHCGLVTIYIPIESDMGIVDFAYFEFIKPNQSTTADNPYWYIEKGAREMLLVQYGSVLPSGIKCPHCGRRLDKTGRYYVFSGLNQGKEDDSVVLRDLFTGDSRVLVAPADANHPASPWFQNGSILYYRSNALWRVSLDGAQNTKMTDPTKPLANETDWGALEQSPGKRGKP